MAASSHFTKAGARAIINASPEPFSNVGASLGEDALALVWLWLVIAHPWLMLGMLLLLLALSVWLLPILWRGLVGVIRGLSLPTPKLHS